MWPLWAFLTLTAAATEVPRWQVTVATDRAAWLASVAWIGSKAQAVDLQWRPPIYGRHDIEIGLTGRLLSTTVLEDGAGGEVGMRLAYAPVGGAYQPSMAAISPSVGLRTESGSRFVRGEPPRTLGTTLATPLPWWEPDRLHRSWANRRCRQRQRRLARLHVHAGHHRLGPQASGRPAAVDSRPQL